MKQEDREFISNSISYLYAVCFREDNHEEEVKNIAEEIYARGRRQGYHDWREFNEMGADRALALK